MQVIRRPEYVAQSNRVFVRSNNLFPTPARRGFSAVAASDAVTVTGEEYQHLPKSPLPTYYFQKSLSRLPIPKLELTSQRYLEALRPLLEDEQYNKTEKIVKDFESSIGKRLHESLLQRDKELKHTSYISAPWFEMYLRDRLPLPINTNPALVFVEDPSIDALPLGQRQLVRSTNLLVSALRFLKSLDAEILGPEVFHLNPKKSDTPKYYKAMKFMPTAFATYGSYLFKAFPLDMSQYTSLFRSTRIPQKDIDRLKKANRNVRHIVVIRRGHFYSFPVLDDQGNVLPVDEIKGGLEAILNDNSPPATHPVGVMTSQERNTWADIREHMSQNNRNQKSLEEIDSALFVLGLDDDELGQDPVTVTRAFLHSDGSNRWFDKSFNLILSKDGWAGVNFEHAWGDGVAVMRFFNEIHADSLTHKWSNTVTSKRPFITPIKLQFELDAKAKQGIEDAQKRLNSQAESLQIHPFIAENYGKKECKKWGISPDSVMQLGFQAAHFHLFNKAGTTYESCSTSAFKHGRTEAIRPATLLTNEVSRALQTSNWQSRKSELKELIKKCSEKHGELTKCAAMGQGFDRHLYALKIMALSQGLELPDLYKDESYRIINHNILSTSTLSSPAVRVGGFGPVVSDGYGIAYQIWDTGLGCLTTSYKGGKEAEAFANACEKVFRDIGEVMRD